jgi:plastocyanin
MKAIWVLVLVPVLALASEECVKQLGGKCRSACAPDEKAEQGAFTDCAEKERCCVPAQARGSQAAPLVVIDGMAFAPEVLKVKAGTEVVWRNDDGSAHTVTAEDGSFASPPLNQGGVFKKVFAKAGTYPYTCEMHPFMSGKIVVD